MKCFCRIIRIFLLILNGLVAGGFLLCAYSPYLSPVNHPVLACSGLAFPVFALLNLLFLFVWLAFRKWLVLFPLVVFLAGWDSLKMYLPLNSQKDSEGGEVIKILTYNVQRMPSDEGDGQGKTDGSNPVLEYLRKSDADILCLQEFVPGDYVSQAQINRALVSYPYKKITRFPGGNGMACYSRFPILSSEFIPYESKFNGSVLYRLKFGADTLTLINNHLESNKLDKYDKKVYNGLLKSPDRHHMETGGRYLLGKLAEAVSIRASQADSVARAISRNRCRYMLVCGDFNDSPISYAHRIVGQGLEDVYVNAGAGPGFTYNQNHFYFRIDHLFASTGFRILQCRVDRSIRASDHYPVWCLLEKL